MDEHNGITSIHTVHDFLLIVVVTERRWVSNATIPILGTHVRAGGEDDDKAHMSTSIKFSAIPN